MREEKARNKNVKLHRMSSKGGIKRTHVYRKEPSPTGYGETDGQTDSNYGL